MSINSLAALLVLCCFYRRVYTVITVYGNLCGIFIDNMYIIKPLYSVFVVSIVCTTGEHNQ